MHGTEHIGQHTVVTLGGLIFHMDTLIMTWITMAAVILVVFIATRGLERGVPKRRWQVFIEMVVEGLIDQLEKTAGPKAKPIAPLIITLFLYLMFANWLGLVPGGFSSPTVDLNTTLGMAVMIALSVHVIGASRNGISHFGHLFQPHWVFLPINLMEEISKPLTMSLRLFGNILAGEILLIILSMLVPWVAPTAWLAFSVFVGIVQALIFTILSIVSLSGAFKDHH
ncbi:F0F1 ATP synthase subunit A [Acetonema longum]|uniref:ATP synthase subunit a n=1 Tax=Acetonema longum DSM 6540 TaxID=1009370 RepID=F7NIT5_9FIRM|nr:F0F1 ATP synthase subunit A [Acetonema longum]EGO64058.1 ATP synthase F0, A subunit [Acetonema longum DSM 6540]